ncbi:hypothetical protein [Streptomyces sp. NPDC127084]
MPGLMSRLKQFTQSPQGRRALSSAKRAASDPRRRAQARSLFSRLRGRR